MGFKNAVRKMAAIHSDPNVLNQIDSEIPGDTAQQSWLYYWMPTSSVAETH